MPRLFPLPPNPPTLTRQEELTLIENWLKTNHPTLITPEIAQNYDEEKSAQIFTAQSKRVQKSTNQIKLGHKKRQRNINQIAKNLIEISPERPLSRPLNSPAQKATKHD